MDRPVTVASVVGQFRADSSAPARLSIRQLVQFGGLGLVGFIAIGLMTTWGVALSNDSVNYIKAARAAIDTGELTITQYQPLYPATLVLAGRLGLDPLVTARWLAAALLLLNLVLVAAFIHRYSDGSTYAAIVGVLLLLSSVPVLRMHSYALSEPLFLALTLISLLLLCRYLEGSGSAYLVAAAAVAGLSLLTRYVGVPLIAASLLAIVLFDTRRSPARLVLFGAIAIGPSLVWLARNYAVSGRLTDRELAFHPLNSTHLQGLATLVSWVVPSTLARSAAALGPASLAILVGVLGLGALLAAVVLIRVVPRVDSARLWRRPALATLAIYLVAYPLSVLLSISLFDQNTQPDSRIMSPLQVAAVLLCCCALGLVRPTLDRRLRESLTLVLAGFIALHAVGAAVLVWTTRAEGQGYASRAWQQSPIVQALRAWPAAVTVYANQAEAVLALTDRPTLDLPWKVRPISRAPNDAYPTQMQAMVNDARRGSAIVVYLYQAETAKEPYRSFIPSEAELQQNGLVLTTRVEDGAIYTGRAP